MTPSFKTQADGRRYAIQVLAQLENVGREKCRADRPGKSPGQHGGLILAMLEIRHRGTAQATIGFGAILTDRIGARVYGIERGEYRELERTGKLRHWKREPDARQGRAGTLTVVSEPQPRQRDAACATDLQRPQNKN